MRAQFKQEVTQTSLGAFETSPLRAHRPNKFKILIGFYQIATRVETVYDILLPAQVRELLLTIQLTISIGIDGIPLACIGANGYIPRLVFWTLLPIVVVATGSLVEAARVSLRGQVTRAALLEAIMPAVLRVFFLSYPIVTNVAFEGESAEGPFEPREV